MKASTWGGGTQIVLKGLQQDTVWVCECVDVANIHVGWSEELTQNQRYSRTVRH